MLNLKTEVFACHINSPIPPAPMQLYLWDVYQAQSLPRMTFVPLPWGKPQGQAQLVTYWQIRSGKRGSVTNLNPSRA